MTAVARQLRTHVSVLLAATLAACVRAPTGDSPAPPPQMFFSQYILSKRGALSKIEYGIDVEMPDQEWEFPAWDKPGIGPITADVKSYRDIPAGTKFMTVRLSYKDGSKGEVVRFTR